MSKKQQKSFGEWHIVVRCVKPHGQDPEIENGLKGKVKLLCETFTLNPNLDLLIAGEEVGSKEKKLHWHISMKLKKFWSDATMRKKIKAVLSNNETFTLRKCKQSWEKMERYTVKTSVFFFFGYTKEQTLEIHNSWKPEEEYKAAVKKEGNTIVRFIYEEMKEKKLPIDDTHVVSKFVVKWYATRYKSCNDFQLKSVIRGILNLNESYQEAYAFKLAEDLLHNIQM